MKKQTILKAGLFFALAVQISWNTHQAQQNNNEIGQASLASISKSNTAAHLNNEGVYLSDNIQTADPIKVSIGNKHYSIGVEVQEGINNLCAATQNQTLFAQLSSSESQRGEINCDSSTYSDYLSLNQNNKSRLIKDAFQKVELKNLPEDLARNLSKRIQTEAVCESCKTQQLATRIYSQAANIKTLADLHESLNTVLLAAAEDTEKERKEKEKKFKEFKRLAKRMQQCELSTPDDLDHILDIDDIDNLELADFKDNLSLIDEALDSKDIKRYKSSSKSKLDCEKDRYTRLADSGLEEEAEKFFFKHMQSDLNDFIKSNPREATNIISDLGMVAGLGLDEWDAHYGLESSYAALQMMNTDVTYRNTLIKYADILRNPGISPQAASIAGKHLYQLTQQYQAKVDLINSNEDKDSTYYNDLTLLGNQLHNNIGMNLTSLYCDAGFKFGMYLDYRCQAASKAEDVYSSLAQAKISNAVTVGIPDELRSLISENRTSLIPQSYQKYTYTNEGFSPSIITDRYDINKLNISSPTRLSESARRNIINNRGPRLQ